MRYNEKRYNSILFPVINNRPQFLLPIKNHCAKEDFIIANENFSNLNNRRKSNPACIFKRRHSFQYVCSFLLLFLSGRITLKIIFYHFQHYITKAYKCITPHFEKPNRVLFYQYRCAPLSLHLSQWQMANETESLIHLHYMQIKRNPE